MPAADLLRSDSRPSFAHAHGLEKHVPCLPRLILALAIGMLAFWQIGPGTEEAFARTERFSAGSNTETAAPDPARPLFLAMSAGTESSGAQAEGQNGPEGASMPEQLLKGSFLGALFFGYPYEGLGTADVALIALAALVAFRIIARKNSKPDDGRFSARQREDLSQTGDKDRLAWPGQENPPPSRSRDKDAGNAEGPGAEKPEKRDSRFGSQEKPVTMKDKASAMWEYYAAEGSGQNTAGFDQSAKIAQGVRLPDGFDAADFLEGARTLYIRLQNAWAARKVDDLAPFVSPELLELLKNQAARDPYAVRMDILLVDAELADLRQSGGREEALVNFAVSMRTGNETHPQDIHEVWRFSRDAKNNGMWRLEGIEQS